jgi:phosphohistidine phosphatase SixA
MRILADTALRLLPLALAAGLAGAAAAQEAIETEQGEIEPVSGFTGQMSMTMPIETPEDMSVEITEVIRFEPWQMLDDLFRDDIVLLMRAGPSEWSAPDAADAAPMDCESQRPLTAQGEEQMMQLGALLVANELRPGRILVSEWCRAQLTYASMEEGMLGADPRAMEGMTVDLDPALNLLGADQGAADVEALRDLVTGWDGGEGEGPLLLVTHFPNIAEFTEFNVYEGEMLILDPRRDGRVLGYLRLASASPDPVHFDPSVLERAGGLEVTLEETGVEGEDG